MHRPSRIRAARYFILKLTDRCNLSCRYCYMYEFDKAPAADNPSTMSGAIFRATVDAIKRHADAHALRAPIVLLHGGEPLLLGKRRFAQYLRYIRATLGTSCRLMIQTNGLLVDADYLAMFEAHAVRVAFSLDGPPPVNDLYRFDKKGRGSAERVLSAIRLTRSTVPSLFGGVLSVINPAVDGRDLVDYFVGLGIRSFDLLLPDGNYATRSIQMAEAPDGRSVGHVLVEAFDAWFERDDPTIAIRIFRELVQAALGRSPTLDLFGNVDGSIAVVETDGKILPHDVLRTCGPPYDRSEINVLTHDFDDLADPRFFPWLALPSGCTRCRVADTCRGGYPPHRYDGVGFDNPSALCADLLMIIDHVSRRVGRTLDASARAGPAAVMPAAAPRLAAAAAGG